MALTLPVSCPSQKLADETNREEDMQNQVRGFNLCRSCISCFENDPDHAPSFHEYPNAFPIVCPRSTVES